MTIKNSYNTCYDAIGDWESQELAYGSTILDKLEIEKMDH